MENPVNIETQLPGGELVMGPGERVILIVDFSDPRIKANDTEFILFNSAPTPYPMGTPPTCTTSRILKFKIESYDHKGKDHCDEEKKVNVCDLHFPIPPIIGEVVCNRQWLLSEIDGIPKINEKGYRSTYLHLLII